MTAGCVGTGEGGSKERAAAAAFRRGGRAAGGRLAACIGGRAGGPSRLRGPRRRLPRFPPPSQYIAPACILLASKIDNSPRTAKDVATAFFVARCSKKHRNLIARVHEPVRARAGAAGARARGAASPPRPRLPLFLTPAPRRRPARAPQGWIEQQMHQVVEAERAVLFALNFDLLVDVPDAWVLPFLKGLGMQRARDGAGAAGSGSSGSGGPDAVANLVASVGSILESRCAPRGAGLCARWVHLPRGAPRQGHGAPLQLLRARPSAPPNAPPPPVPPLIPAA
jgi:hypothetical protein